LLRSYLWWARGK